MQGSVVCASASRRLYSPLQVVAAAFLGSPLASGLLLAEDCVQLGQRWLALGLVLGSVLLPCALIAMPASHRDLAGAAAWPVCAAAALIWQGWRYRAHRAAGGRRQPWWKVVALALLAWVLVAVLCVVPVIIGWPR